MRRRALLGLALTGLVLAACTHGAPVASPSSRSPAPVRDPRCLSSDRPGLITCAEAFDAGGEHSMTNTYAAWIEPMTEHSTGEVLLVWMVRSFLVPTELDGPKPGCILASATSM